MDVWFINVVFKIFIKYKIFWKSAFFIEPNRNNKRGTVKTINWNIVYWRNAFLKIYII